MCSFCHGLVHKWSVNTMHASAARSPRSPRKPRTRIMFLPLLCVLAAVAAAPSSSPHYDQRQDGELNIQADVQNVMLLVLLPSKKINLPFGAADLIGDLLSSKKSKKNNVLQNRADLHVLGAFVEPNSPYHVEIGDERSVWPSKGEKAEVIIAGRGRPSTVEAQPERLHEQPTEASEAESNWDTASDDDFKLIGALEQCGPGRRRDPDTLMCRDETPTREPQSAVQPATSISLGSTAQTEKSLQSVEITNGVRSPVVDSPILSETSSKYAASAEPTTSTQVILRTPPPVKSLPPVLFPKPASLPHLTSSIETKTAQPRSYEDSMWLQKPASPAALGVKLMKDTPSSAESSSISTPQIVDTSTEAKTTTQPVASSKASTVQDPQSSSLETSKSPSEGDSSKAPPMNFSTLHPSIRIVDLS